MVGEGRSGSGGLHVGAGLGVGVAVGQAPSQAVEVMVGVSVGVSVRVDVGAQTHGGTAHAQMSRNAPPTSRRVLDRQPPGGPGKLFRPLTVNSFNP